MSKMKRFLTRAGRFFALLLCVVLIGVCVSPIAVNARKNETTVRVGWYISPFNMIDQFGRRSGYAYEYQQKIAAYTGWNYVYVEGTWSELIQKLADGEIDLMSDVSYTEERAEYMLYSTLPMGAEDYYIFISPKNTDYSPGDYDYFSGKRVGVIKDSFQAGLYREWEQKTGVSSDLIDLNCSESEALEMVRTGELDAFVTMDAYGGADIAVPVVKIGSSDFYFAVSKDRPELIEELNAAHSRILDENLFYNQELNNRYVSTAGANLFLSAGEKEWLSEHGKIRVAYQDNDLAFCAADKTTGALTGALKDYLDDASECFENAQLVFEPVAYPTAAEAIHAVRSGKADCMFPSNLTTSDGESLSLVMTPSMISTELYAIVRKADQQTFFQKEQITAAVIAGDPNYDAIMMESFPDWKQAGFEDIPSCLEAVSKGEADCVLISNYQYAQYAKQCDRQNLTLLATGQETDYCIAVKSGNTELYSILTRTVNIISKTNITSSLSYYSAMENKTTLIDFIRENPAVVIAVIAVLVALIVIIVMQQRFIRAKKEVEKSHHQVNDLNKLVYFDKLTSVRNKGGFDVHLNDIQSRIDGGGQVEFGIVILDCNNLKQINDQYGHDKGDVYLQTASRLICRVYKFSPVFRIGGDEFAVILQNEDYRNRSSLIELFKRNEAMVTAAAENEWDKVSVAIGMADYEPQVHQTVDDVVREADQKMYENKRASRTKKPED